MYSLYSTVLAMELVNNYDKLKKAYLNEFNCPELLPYEGSLVRAIEQEIEQHEENVESKQESGKENEYFISRILLMGLERTKYLLSSYLHTRLAKIEKYSTFLLKDTDIRVRMSAEEDAYAEKFNEMVVKYFHQAALDQLPAAFTNVEEPEMIEKPNLDAHVICRVDESIGDVEIEPGGSSVKFEKGDVVAIRYRPIRGLVLSHRVSFC